MTFSIDDRGEKTNRHDYRALALQNMDVTEEELDELIEEKKETYFDLVTRDDSAIILIGRDRGVHLTEIAKEETKLELELENIVPGMRDVEVEGKVHTVDDEFTKSDVDWRVRSVVIRDESGKAQISFWDEDSDTVEKLKRDDIIRIKGGYTKEEGQLSDYVMSQFGVPGIQTGDDTTLEIKKEDGWETIID